MFSTRKYIPDVKYCNNCGKFKHTTKECPEPVISLGMIVYKRIGPTNIKYAMIRRRNTIGYVQIIRGKYAFSDEEYIQKLFNVLTEKEKELIKRGSFKEMWEYLWYDEKYKKVSERTLYEYNLSNEKFQKLKDGYLINEKKVSLDYFMNNKELGNHKYEEQEWGFPKGRRKSKEGDVQTALREFSEETGIKLDKIFLNEEKVSFIEEYKSYDNVVYRNKYFLAEYTGEIDNTEVDENRAEQYSEVSKIQFMDLSSCIGKIRDYETEKKEVIIKVHSYIVNGNLL